MKRITRSQTLRSIIDDNGGKSPERNESNTNESTENKENNDINGTKFGKFPKHNRGKRKRNELVTPPLVSQNRGRPKSKNPLATEANDVDTSKRISNKNQTNDKNPFQMPAKGPILKLKRLNLEEYSHLIYNYGKNAESNDGGNSNITTSKQRIKKANVNGNASSKKNDKAHNDNDGTKLGESPKHKSGKRKRNELVTTPLFPQKQRGRKSKNPLAANASISEAIQMEINNETNHDNDHRSHGTDIPVENVSQKEKNAESNDDGNSNITTRKLRIKRATVNVHASSMSNDKTSSKTNDCVQFRRSKRKIQTVTEPESLRAKRRTMNGNNDEKNKIKKRSKLSLKEKLDNEAPIKQFLPNEVVLATVPGYCPWPARILTITDHTILIEFFGTGQINPVRSTALSRFDITRAIPLLQRKGYAKAMREVEMVLKIPNNVSLFQN